MPKTGRSKSRPCGRGQKKGTRALKPVATKGFHGAWGGGLAPAQELVYDGWELLDDDVREAKKCFDRAIALDPDIADAHNGLAEIAVAKGEWVAAERHYLKAYEKAKMSLGTEDPKAFAWWGNSRPVPTCVPATDWACSISESGIMIRPSDYSRIFYGAIPTIIRAFAILSLRRIS